MEEKKLPNEHSKELKILYKTKEYFEFAFNCFVCRAGTLSNDQFLIQTVQDSLWRSGMVAYYAGFDQVQNSGGAKYESCNQIKTFIINYSKKNFADLNNINLHEFMISYRSKAICHSAGTIRNSFKIIKLDNSEYKIKQDIGITGTYDGRDKLYAKYIEEILKKISAVIEAKLESIKEKLTSNIIDFNKLQASPSLILDFKSKNIEHQKLEFYNPDYFK